MTSFQLVNQKLKHIFGGLQTQVNLSVQNLYQQHKKVTTALSSQSSLFRKMQTNFQNIKSNCSQLHEIYKNMLKQSKTKEALSLDKIMNQFFKSWNKLGDEIIQWRQRSEKQLQQWIPTLKKLYAEHKQASQQLQHYKAKMTLLQKRFGDQDPNSHSLASNVKDVSIEEINRYYRNQQKLKNAQTTYDRITQKLNLQYSKYNKQGQKVFLDNYGKFMGKLIVVYEDVIQNTRKLLNIKTTNIRGNILTPQQQQFAMIKQIENIIKGQQCNIIGQISMDKYFEKFNNFEILQTVLKSQVRNKKKTVMQLNKKKLQVPENRPKKYSENIADGFQDIFFKKEKPADNNKNKNYNTQLIDQQFFEKGPSYKQSQTLSDKGQIIPDFENDFTAFILNKINQKQHSNKSSNSNSPTKKQHHDLIDFNNINQKQFIDAKDMDKVLNNPNSSKKSSFPQFLDLV